MSWLFGDSGYLETMDSMNANIAFIVASLIIRPDATSLYGAVAVVAWNNILIHTPALETASSFLPGIFVGTDRHLEHQ